MRILFVCLGNICRSPTAEGVLRALAEREMGGVVTAVDSAGTADYHIGEPPDPRSCAAAARRGYDLSALRARQVEAADFERFDLLLAMDRANHAALRRIAPRGSASRVARFLPLVGYPGLEDVPDPYYGESSDFDFVVELIERASGELLRQLAAGRIMRG